jgi:SecD/SecF fusion protein
MQDSFDQLGKPASVNANEWSGQSLGRINWKSYTQKSNIAIVLDNIVYCPEF